MQKFLIIQTAFIGDVVLATSMIEKLHQFFPGARIDFLLRKGNEQLLEGHPFVHTLLIWDKKKNKQKNLLHILRQIRKNRYDTVINAQRFFATGLITSLSGARETIGFDKNPMSIFFTKRKAHRVGGASLQHEIERNQELIADFTDSGVLKPKLYPSQNDFLHIDHLKQKNFLTISPASVWFTKQFPAVQWIRFIKVIPDYYTIYLLGGPGDISLCQSIAEDAGGKSVTVLAGKLSYLQSAALMGFAKMNYVNDSAPMHFASAMNAPVTAVYCSTIPEFGFGPLSDIRHIVEIQEKLYCRPCGLHGYAACPETHFKCALHIDTSQLVRALPEHRSVSAQ